MVRTFTLDHFRWNVSNSCVILGDILREIVYNVFQAQSLSFLGSVSLGYRFDTEGTIQYPDENFAREILQVSSLFRQIQAYSHTLSAAVFDWAAGAQ